MKTPDLKSVERAFYSDGYRLGMKAAKNLQSNKDFFEAIQEMYNLIDTMIDSLSEYAALQRQKIDCKKGCSWCCYQPVFALNYELDYLNAFIKRKFTKSNLEIIRKNAHIKKEKLDGLESEAILKSKHACPLLQNGVCSAYQARPVACRIYLSTDVNSCINFYHEPEDEKSFPALLHFPMQVGRMINEGFKAALKESGWELNEYRIEQGIVNNLS